MAHPWMFVVLLGMVCIVFSFLAPKAVVSKSPDMVKEIEETMEHFANEIEEENKELLESVIQMKNLHDNQVARLSDKIDQLEKQSYTLSQELKVLALDRVQQPSGNLQAAAASLNNDSTGTRTSTENQSTATPMQMKTRYASVFQLHDQGKSIEYIAKKLGLNKGEIQLIIQLAKQEEQSRV